MLTVEVDGKDHFTDEGVERDKQRDKYLNELGYQVLRIPGYDILNDCQSVLKRGKETIRQLAAHH